VCSGFLVFIVLVVDLCKYLQSSHFGKLEFNFPKKFKLILPDRSNNRLAVLGM
jgi:hypothetical protein